jgi:hypothetical protein
MSGAPALGSTLSVVRAVVLREAGGPEVLRVEELPDPLPGEGEVLVRVEAVGINHADLTRRAGGADTFPLILGYDAAGRREDGGERVLVTGTPGTYAELVAAKEENVFAIPDSLETAAAAALGVPYKTGSTAGAAVSPSGSSATTIAAILVYVHLAVTALAAALFPRRGDASGPPSHSPSRGSGPPAKYGRAGRTLNVTRAEAPPSAVDRPRAWRSGGTRSEPRAAQRHRRARCPRGSHTRSTRHNLPRTRG